MIEYVSFDVQSGDGRWARVFIQRQGHEGKVYFDVRKASAYRLVWLCSSLADAGIGRVRPSALGWYWRR